MGSLFTYVKHTDLGCNPSTQEVHTGSVTQGVSSRIEYADAGVSWGGEVDKDWEEEWVENDLEEGGREDGEWALIMAED